MGYWQDGACRKSSLAGAEQGVDAGVTHHASRITHHASRTPSLDWPVLALLASGLLSTLFAQNKGVAVREFYMVFLGGALFYWLITRMRWPAGRGFAPMPLLNGFLAGMVAVSLVALWQFATGEGRIDVEGVWRVRALYGSPNNLALVLDRAIPLALALALFGRPRRVWLAVWHWAAVVVMALACVATFSKGALLLGLPVGLGLVLIGGAWRSRRRWPLWLFGGLTAVGALGLLALFRTQRFADLLNFRTGTSFVRLKLWRGAWQHGARPSAVGRGAGQLPLRLSDALRAALGVGGAGPEPSAQHRAGSLDAAGPDRRVGRRLGVDRRLAARLAALQDRRAGCVAHRPRPARRPGRDPGARSDR